MPKPVEYIQRTRRYYLALGYDTPYRWARNNETPFTALPRPLTDSTVALITTSALFDPEKGAQGPGAAYNGAAKYFTPYAASIDGLVDTRISHIAYDRDHSSAEDQRAWLPLEAMKAAVGRIGAVAPRFHGLPTDRSLRNTLETYAPAIFDALQEDGADAAILVPNCPVCHQSVTLVARFLEERGIPTVIMGCAKDIVESAGAPRFVFSDFPLGNGAGKPHDPASQSATLALALDLLENAAKPTTLENPLVWSDDPSWKEDYSNPDKLSEAEIASRRAEFDAQKRKIMK